MEQFAAENLFHQPKPFSATKTLYEKVAFFTKFPTIFVQSDVAT
jgi:hypothetical protein